MKTANEILFEHGINTMSLNDDFNSQLFHAMERYAEEKIRDSDEWISIEDKLPEAGKMVLFATKDWYQIGKLVHLRFEADDQYNSIIKPTHWRLLPAPPNEKSASLKPNKLSDSEIQEMAESYGCGSHNAEQAFIAGCKAIIELNKK